MEETHVYRVFKVIQQGVIPHLNPHPSLPHYAAIKKENNDPLVQNVALYRSVVGLAFDSTVLCRLSDVPPLPIDICYDALTLPHHKGRYLEYSIPSHSSQISFLVSLMVD